MATIRVTQAIATSVCGVVQTAIDAGTLGGTVEIYTGTMPAKPETGITSQVLLGTCTFDTTSGSIAAGVFTAAAITQDSAADATGTATWARLRDGDGTTVLDCDVTTVGGGGAIQMVTTSIVIGGPIAFTSFTITMPPGTWA